MLRKTSYRQKILRKQDTGPVGMVANASEAGNAFPGVSTVAGIFFVVLVLSKVSFSDSWALMVFIPLSMTGPLLLKLSNSCPRMKFLYL